MTTDKKPRWFVYDYYTAAGRPKLEDALMEEAKTIYLYRIIVNPDQMVEFMKQRQEVLYAANKRLKKVDIKFSHSVVTDHAHFKIGQQSLRMRKIRED